MRDYFQDLGLERTASVEEIRKAYLRLVKIYHPDRLQSPSPQAQKKFLLIQEAYKHLNSSEKVAEVRGALSFRASSIKQKSDAKKDVIRTRASSSVELERNDLLIELSLRTFAANKVLTIEYEVLDPCSACIGSGRKLSAKQERCSRCKARGFIEISRGANQWRKSCDQCRGTGRLSRIPCDVCSGKGSNSQSITQKFVMPSTSSEHISIPDAGQRDRTGSCRGKLVIRWR